MGETTFKSTSCGLYNRGTLLFLFPGAVVEHCQKIDPTSINQNTAKLNPEVWVLQPDHCAIEQRDKFP